MSSIQIEQNGHVRTIPLPAGETLLSVLRRAGYSIPAACGGKGRCGKCRVPVNGVPRLACRVYPADGDTVTLPETAGGTILTGTVPLPACRPGRTGCAAAVDLGTTTVVARLYDLSSGTELQTCSGWNAQAPYGADVISRIQYTLEKPDGLPELSRRIREQIWALVSDALARSGRTPGTLREITLAGNTVMQHLFAGYSVRGIAAAPFRPETLFAAPGDETLHGVPVHCAPCVAGYVGGDITAGLLAAGLAELHPPEIGPETVYITRLCRTRQTAERLFPHATLVETDGLEEMDFGDFEGRSANDMEHDPAYCAWVDPMCQGPCPNGESQAQFIRRVTEAFARLLDAVAVKGSNLTIVAHGGTQLAVLSAFADPKKPYFDWSVPCGHSYVLDASRWPTERRLTVLAQRNYTKEAAP